MPILGYSGEAIGSQYPYPQLKTRVVAGATAGNVTVTGIALGDILLVVQRIDAAAANATAEFTITATNTINNAGGTSTASGLVLVMWYTPERGQTGRG